MDKTIKERGIFKTKIHSALYNENILEAILGDIEGKSSSDLITGFKDHVKSHLFVDETIEDTGAYIFYDVMIPVINSNIKECVVKMWAICHRDTLDSYYKDGYYGNKADILSEMIEEILLDDTVTNKFGIGELSLESVGVYNSVRFYGSILTFSVNTFR